MFFGLFIFRGHSTREPASNRVTYCILRAYTGTGVSNSRHRKKTGRDLEKNAGEWTGRVEISKEEIPGSKLSLPSKGRTFKLCVLNRWEFNFCVRSSPLWEWGGGGVGGEERKQMLCKGRREMIHTARRERIHAVQREKGDNPYCAKGEKQCCAEREGRKPVL